MVHPMLVSSRLWDPVTQRWMPGRDGVCQEALILRKLVLLTPQQLPFLLFLPWSIYVQFCFLPLFLAFMPWL